MARINQFLGTLAVTAETTDDASAFMFDNASAVRACALEEDSLRMLYFVSVGCHVSLNRFGHRIGTGQNFVFTET